MRQLIRKNSRCVHSSKHDCIHRQSGETHTHTQIHTHSPAPFRIKLNNIETTGQKNVFLCLSNNQK